MANQINPTKLAELLAKARALKTPDRAPVSTISSNSLNKLHQAYAKKDSDKANREQAGLTQFQTMGTITSLSKDGTTSITLNEKQSSAVKLALGGKSLIVIGAAGTGKTTTTREIINQLVNSGQAGTHQDGTHKHL